MLTRRGFLGLLSATTGLALVEPKSLFAFKTDIEFYDVAGQTIFPMYGISGSIAAQAVLFPMARFGNKVYIFGYKITTQGMLTERIEVWEELHERAKDAFMKAWLSATRIAGSLDGGDMPINGEIVVCELS